MRFIALVPIGCRIHCKMIHQSVEYKGAGRYLFKSKKLLRLKGEPPESIAEWLGMLAFSDVEDPNAKV